MITARDTVNFGNKGYQTETGKRDIPHHQDNTLCGLDSSYPVSLQITKV